MADNAVITSEQVISPTVFTPTIEQATLLEVKLNQLIGSFETLATVTGKKLGSTADPKTIKDLQEQKEAIDNINQAQKAQIETEKIRIKTTELGATLRKKELSNWDDLTQRLNVATRSYKEIAAAQGVGSKAAVDAALAVNKLKDEQTGINRAIGNYSDQVGNYSGALQNYVITLRGLRGPVKLLGEALGIGAYEADNIRLALEHSLQGYAAYQRAAEKSKDSVVAQNVATQINTTEKQENIIATEGEAAAMGEAAIATDAATVSVGFLDTALAILLAPLTLIIAGVALLGSAAYLTYLNFFKLTEQQKDFKEASLEAIKSYEKEVVAAQENYKTSIDLSESFETRKKAIEDLHKLAPITLQNLTVENAANAEYADLINNKVIPAIKARAGAVAAQQILVQKQIDLQTAQSENVTNKDRAISALLRLGRNLSFITQITTKNVTATDIYDGRINKLSADVDGATDNLKKFQDAALGANDVLSDDNASKTFFEGAKRIYEARATNSKVGSSAELQAKQDALTTQHTLDLLAIKGDEDAANKKLLIDAKYYKDSADLQMEFSVKQVQNERDLQLSLLNLKKSLGQTTPEQFSDKDYEIKKTSIEKEIVLRKNYVNEVKLLQKQLIDLEASHNNETVKLYNERKKITEEDEAVNIEGIKDTYDHQIAQEKLSLQKKLDAIKGFSDEENKLRADLIKQSQQKLDYLTIQKGLHQAKNITDATVSNTTPGTQANYSARIADLKAEEAIELQLVETNESAKAAIVAKYEKQIRDIQHQSNIEAHQDAIDNYDAQIILLKLKGDSFANLDKIRTAERLKAKEEEDKAIAEANGDPDKILLAQANYAKAIFDIDKQIADEKIAQAQRASDAIVKITEDRIAIEQAANKEALDKYATQIQQQTQLAVAGKANTLAYLERQQAAAYVRQAQLDKQAAKVKEGQELANIFLAFMKVNASKGLAAAPESLAETLVAKGIGEALASFYVGTEDTGAGGNLDSKGGMLAVLHPNERVLTAEQNSKLGKVSNEQLVNSFIKLNYYPAIKDISPREEMSNAMAEMLHKDMEKLTETIKNKREQAIDWNSLNEMIIRQTENGLTRETTHKNSTFIISKRTFN